MPITEDEINNEHLLLINTDCLLNLIKLIRVNYFIYRVPLLLLNKMIFRRK